MGGVMRNCRHTGFNLAARASFAVRLSTLLLCSLLAVQGCSVKQLALKKAADTLADSGTTYASDDDPELIRSAAPFSLKLMDGILVEVPQHRGLLTAAASGYTGYTYAFIHQDAEVLEDTDVTAAATARARAKLLYTRAHRYAVAGLDIAHPGLSARMQQDPRAALSVAVRDDVPLLYWNAASLGALIGLSKDDPELVAGVPVVEALIDRALVLNESYDAGAIHTFLISYEMVRQSRRGDPAASARAHFQRAVQLSDGYQAGPYVALAEAVCVGQQNRVEFELLLSKALAIDVDNRPQWRLANVVMQRRARWLLSRTDQLFAESRRPRESFQQAWLF
jgi:predicted anti-sigma-YlaC factor YlaD